MLATSTMVGMKTSTHFRLDRTDLALLDKLQKLIPHCDNRSDVLRVAIRELWERVQREHSKEKR